LCIEDFAGKKMSFAIVSRLEKADVFSLSQSDCRELWRSSSLGENIQRWSSIQSMT